jgi:hypothetical protein
MGGKWKGTRANEFIFRKCIEFQPTHVPENSMLGKELKISIDRRKDLNLEAMLQGDNGPGNHQKKGITQH